MARPVLITAGATRNPLDAIRYLSAHATGRTGVWLADQLASGVTLLGSEEACLRASRDVVTEVFTSTRNLMERMEIWLTEHPESVVIHSAAVGDYEADPSETKIPSGQERLTLTLHPTPKILDHIRDWAPQTFLVSFKAAPPQTTPSELTQIAKAQLQRSHSDLVFANVIGDLQAGVQLVDGRGANSFDTRVDALQQLVRRVAAAR